MSIYQNPHYKVHIQTDDFDLASEYQHIREQAKGDGAIVTFTGIVRDFAPSPQSSDAKTSEQQKDKGKNISAIELEHYPEMTEKSLVNIIEQALKRWQLGYVTIIHRVGVINADQQIVFVGTSSRHRRSAFEAAEFLMDYLKNEVPLWKREHDGNEATWVSAKESDHTAMKRWELQ